MKTWKEQVQIYLSGTLWTSVTFSSQLTWFWTSFPSNAKEEGLCNGTGSIAASADPGTK